MIEPIRSGAERPAPGNPLLCGDQAAEFLCPGKAGVSLNRGGYGYFWTTGIGRTTQASLGFALLLLARYESVVAGARTMMTRGVGPSGPLFVADPVAGSLTAPMQQVAAHFWRIGQLPLWLPSEGFGQSLAANQGAVWFPLEVVVHLLVPHDYSAWNLLRLFLLAVGTYGLAREMGVSFAGGLLAGSLAALAGPAPPNTNLDMLNPLMVLPFLLIVSRRLLSGERKLAWAAATSLLMALLWLAGFDEVLPLLMVVWALFCLALLAGGAGRGGLVRCGAWLGACTVAGVAGSAIATLPLLSSLHSSFSYQSPMSYLAHVPAYWLITLLNPWAFGRGVAGGAFDMGQSVWIVGNVVMWVLLVSAVAGLVRTRSDGPERFWWYACTALTVLGILGYANVLGILRVFGWPPFDLILMIRFLPFLWWLPACTLAGYGFDHLDAGASRWLGALSGCLACAALGGEILALHTLVAAPEPVHMGAALGLLREAVPAAVFAAATAAAVLLPHSWRRAGLLTITLLSLLVYAPANFFPRSSGSGKLAAEVARVSGPNASIFVSGGGTLPLQLARHGDAMLQAMGVFYPRRYVSLLTASFGSPGNVGQPSSTLFFGAPTLSSLPLTPGNLQRLAALGVGTLVTALPVFSDSFVANGMFGPGVEAAVTALAHVYSTRPDLQAAFPFGSPTFSLRLLQWATTFGISVDSAHTVLAPFAASYRSLLRQVTADPRSPAIFSATASLFSGVLRVAGTAVTAGGPNWYLYRLVPAGATVWRPAQVRAGSFRTVRRVLAGSTPDRLLSRAYVTGGSWPHGSVLDQSGVHVRVLSLRAGGTFTRIRLDTTGGRALVVIRSLLVPGETVRVNGVTVPPREIDGAWTGVTVPTGRALVVLDFLTPQLRLAWYLSLTTILVCALVLLLSVWAGRRRVA